MDAQLVAHAAHFERQAEWCDALGSPFNAALLRGLAATIGTSGVVDRLLTFGEAPLTPKAADAGPLRIAGALHASTLLQPDSELAGLYPAAMPGWDMNRVLTASLATLEREYDWVAKFILNTPQTNETRRSIAMLPAFASLAGPLHLREVGASAGLNQHWDAFGYDGGHWSRAGAPGAPVIASEWVGPPPRLPDSINIASRRGCDRSPLDVENPEHRLRLISYIWPDQADRLVRVRAAIEIARLRGVSIETSDAADWLERTMAEPLGEGTTVVFHSIAWQYFDRETGRRARRAIEGAGARADSGHRLAWLRFEHQKSMGEDGKDHLIDLITWPGGTRRIIARADPHAVRIELL